MNYHETWTAMNDLQESFNKISTIEFLCDELQRAVDSGDQQKIVDITHTMTAFLPVYTDYFEKKFDIAWKTTVTPVFMSVKENNNTVEKYEEVCKYFDSKC